MGLSTARPLRVQKPDQIMTPRIADGFGGGGHRAVAVCSVHLRRRVGPNCIATPRMSQGQCSSHSSRVAREVCANVETRLGADARQTSERIAYAVRGGYYPEVEDRVTFYETRRLP